jgi:hypothetical protein
MVRAILSEQCWLVCCTCLFGTELSLSLEAEYRDGSYLTSALMRMSMYDGDHGMVKAVGARGVAQRKVETAAGSASAG